MTIVLFFVLLFFAGFATGYFYAYKTYAKYLAEQQKTIAKLYEELEGRK